MGKQLQLCSTKIDNTTFSNYLKENFDCEFYQNFSPTKEGLLVNNINETFYEHSDIYIYNKIFSWSPTFSQTISDEKLNYIQNTNNAPLIIFSKTDFVRDRNGRIYWSKYFSGIPEYDVNEFEKFYNEITKWIKRNTKGKVKSGNINIHYLEDAWANKANKKL